MRTGGQATRTCTPGLYVRDGQMHFRPDVYGRDDALMDALEPAQLSRQASEQVLGITDLVQ